MQLLAGNRRVASTSARGPCPCSLACEPLVGRRRVPRCGILPRPLGQAKRKRDQQRALAAAATTNLTVSRSTRVDRIKALEEKRKSRVLAVVMGERPGLETRIAPDLIPLAAKHLRAIGEVERIDLFLYSGGGDIMAGFRLVSLIREYCKHFAVIVPFRCQSTATLITLGADEIVMLPEGQLSPVDPSTSGPYNPMIPGAQFQPGGPLPVLPVSVEDVVSYVSLAKEVAGIQGESGLVSVFEKLTSDVRPLALGQVYRARTQIRMLTRKLLQAHMSNEDPMVDAIVATLTEKLYSHDYIISRREAQSIGLKVAEPDRDLEADIVQLYEGYSSDLQLLEPFSPVAELKGRPQVALTLDRAYVETVERLDSYRTEKTLAVQAGQLVENLQRESWVQLT